MFQTLAALPAGCPERTRLRERLVEMHLPLVRFLALRYARRGEPMDDLFQAGALGLIKAVDRFDLSREVDFSTYAGPTVLGEIKRHFRDRTWTVHVHRRMQELLAAVGFGRDELTAKLGRAPTVAELAERLQIDQEEVLEALTAAGAYSPESVDAIVGEDNLTLADTLGSDDPRLEHVEFHHALAPMLTRLPARERRILQLRFYGNRTQSQIAAELGISQMHVSRLLSRTLASLREQLLADS
jgi:RNA polymerase sigma-B factor